MRNKHITRAEEKRLNAMDTSTLNIVLDFNNKNNSFREQHGKFVNSLKKYLAESKSFEPYQFFQLEELIIKWDMMKQAPKALKQDLAIAFNPKKLKKNPISKILQRPKNLHIPYSY